MNKAPISESLDLLGVPCPQNTARVLLKLELMDDGEVLQVFLDDGEPIENVPPSIIEDGHKIIGKHKIDGKWELLIEKGN